MKHLKLFENFQTDVLQYFHHTHDKDGQKVIHHCGGDHVKIDPDVNYTIEHCSCGKHHIDKEYAIGHGPDMEKTKFKFTEKCPDGGWHLESGIMNVFESHAEEIQRKLDIIQDLKDICLELEDEGFIIEIGYHPIYGNNPPVKVGGVVISNPTPQMKLRVKMGKNNRNFSYEEVSEVAERIKDYMNRVGYSTKIERRNQSRRLGTTGKLFIRKLYWVFLIFTEK